MTTTSLPPSEVNSSESGAATGIRRLVIFHGLIGLGLFAFPAMGTLFALLVVLRVLVSASTSRRLDDLFASMGYAVGVEVLWRMTGAKVPWEVTKYLLILVSVIGLARFPIRRWSWAPVVFAVAFVPSSVLTLTAMSLSEAREALVSNLAGPAALALLALLSGGAGTNRNALVRVLWSVVIGLVPMSTFVALKLVTARNVTFSGESELAASGGFGPNQVSVALSLGLLAVFFLVFVLGDRRRGLLVALGSWFLVAMLLTFSRGGLASFAVAAVVVTAVRLADARRLLLTVCGVIVGSLLAVGVLLPALDGYTGGKLSERYEDSSTAHRSEIAESDWSLFEDHPFIGVGPGRSQELRAPGPAQGRQSHVAFTRFLSEHGLFGLMALGALGTIVVRALARASERDGVAWSAGSFAWALVTMAHADMRLAAVSFSFGIGCLMLVSGRDPVHEPEPGPGAASLWARTGAKVR